MITFIVSYVEPIHGPSGIQNIYKKTVACYLCRSELFSAWYIHFPERIIVECTPWAEPNEFIGDPPISEDQKMDIQECIEAMRKSGCNFHADKLERTFL